MVFYTNHFLKPQFKGMTFGPLIFIRPEWKGDAGLLEHEQMHVKQFWRTFGVHALLYTFSPGYRLKAEAEAYKCQYRIHPDRLLLYAEFIATRYNLHITTTAAAQAILDAP